jgi:hypothetical protein
MPTITTRVHPGTVSSVLRLVADWTAGIWDLSSLAFTIPTGLAGRRTTTLSSLPAVRTCYCPPCLSAQGQSRDLQHSSPMLARCGNIALRDIAHMGICPIDACIPHVSLLSLKKPFLGQRVLRLRCSFKARSSNGRSPQERHQGSAICSNRSSRGKGIGFPWWVQQLRTASIGLAEALNTGAYKHITV